MTANKTSPAIARRALAAALMATTVLTSGTIAMSTPSLAKDAQTTQYALPGSFSELVRKARPAVVSILVKKSADAQKTAQKLPQGLQEFFKQFGTPGLGSKPFGTPKSGKSGRPMMGQGSGFFISSDGFIVTNNHVIDGADSIKVRLHDGTEYEAERIGTDPKTDLAVLKVAGTEFTHVKFGDSDKTNVGDWVVAMGNPFGLSGTTTAGIVSARGRDIGSGPYDDFIQIDASINKGNSGGPAFNRSGEVIGVNTAIFSPSGGSVGIGFAVPSKVAEKVVESLIAHGKVDRGWLGVSIQNVSEDIADSLGIKAKQGALVASVNDNSPAGKAGIKAGDVVLEVDGDPIKSTRDLTNLIADKGPSATVKVKLWRAGKDLALDVTLKEIPGQDVASIDMPTDDGKPRLGLMLKETEKGVVIANVQPGSPAAEKGLRSGEIIARVGSTTVTSVDDVREAVAALSGKADKRVLMLIKGANGQRFVALKPRKSVG